MHQVGILRRVLIEVLQDRDRAEAQRTEEELRGKIGLPHLEHDPTSPLRRQLADELFHHARADTKPPMRPGYGEVEHVQTAAVQFVDHEGDHRVTRLRHHPDTVSLPQAAGEVFVGPGEFEGLPLDIEHFSHVSTDHPADMNPQPFFVGRSHVCETPCVSD